ncbi:MAG: IS66 family transposase [Firmicutes bacterium]|nr:IS66 family transposase [Bacillota bacterium]
MDIVGDIDNKTLIAMDPVAVLTSENAILKYQNNALINEITQLRDENAELRRQVTDLKTANDYYECQARLYRHQLFGQSSEKTVDQCAQTKGASIKEAEGEAGAGPQPIVDQNGLEQEYDEVDVKAHKRHKRKGKREEDLKNLPVEREEIELPESGRICADCGAVMHDIGVEIRRELVFIPGRYIIKEYAIHKYACCERYGDHSAIIEAEAPKPLIPRSLASPSAVAFIAVQKYVYCVPLYRLEQGFKRDGFFLSRQTMANWVIKCVRLYLITIYTLMKTPLLKESVLHSDATVVQVLREEDRKAKTKSYEWLYRTTGCAEHQIVIYEYTQTKGRENPALFLQPFRGLLHCDGDKSYRELDGVILVGCWAHARRKYHDVLKALPEGDDGEGSFADRAVTCINYLFHLEHEFEDLSPEERYIKRLQFSKPIADNYFEWVKAVKGVVAPGFPIGQALNYSLNQQEYLQNVFLNGRLEFSNNRAERSIKAFVMGRKNWLFSNSPEGAEASSVVYSIIETAIENGLDPYRYIVYLLETLPKTTRSGAAALLPWSADLPEDCRSRVTMKKVNQVEDDEY